MQFLPNYAARPGGASPTASDHLAKSSWRLVSGHMGNTRLQRHNGPRPAVQHTEPQRPQVNVPQAILDGLDADRLATKRLADEHLRSAPLDAAVTTHAAA